MSGRPTRAWLVLLPAVALGVAVLAPTAPPESPVPAAAAPFLGLALGAALFRALAGARARYFAFAPAAAVAGVAVAASEETIWRGFALARLAPGSGVAAGVALAAAGFAATHYPTQRWRGVAVHMGTGTAFGTLYAATGSLSAAVTAHAVYNLFALSARAEPASAARPAPPAAIEARGIEKRFGRVEALRGVDLTVRRGQVVALLGPNGAGKTTLVSILLGLRGADAGRAAVFGHDAGSRAARVRVAATPQEMSFPPTLRVGEIVDFVLAHHPRLATRDELLTRFGLAELAGRQSGGISPGQRRLLALAVSLGTRRELAVLDEPTTGLDVETRRSIWQAIRSFAAEGGTILMTTHSLEEAEALADRVVVLREGAVAAAGRPDDLRRPGDASFEETYLRLVEHES